ncbi:hypothetical protein CAC42_1433 [Sphaceloma murrayae]|uniref:DNA-directed RNA polymerase III subunit RPC6 n=1 Tax=Sphaceloma murrayae TaxID=2082308 RepID=A0A2K1QGD5_9PEZI|nr:hypothetical protein CAC42_1433 [Sphaceloma murrayae]
MAKVEGKLEEQCEDLYQKMIVRSSASSDGKAKTFTQDEIHEISGVKDQAELLGLLQGLADKHFVRFMALEGKTVFALRTRELAAKLSRLTQDESVVYNNIENEGLRGAWTKRIKLQTSLVQTVVNKVIKTLESRELIKAVKNIKAPAQKSYILAHLSPGEDVTGGPWHSDGELDSEMIGISANVVIKYVESKSWDHKTIRVERHRSVSPIDLAGDSVQLKEEPKSPSRSDGTSHATSGKRRREGDTGDIEDLARRKKKYDKIEVQVAWPPGYLQYPTAEEIFKMLSESGFIRNQIRLEDIKGFLDMLVMDERIERVGAGFRTVRGIRGGTKMMQTGLQDGLVSQDDQELEENGLTQTPCGRCPVFDLCEEGGPVNATNCEYFDTWLKA